MEECGPIADARQAFEYFVKRYLDPANRHQLKVPASVPTDRREDAYLQEYLQGWLERGNGVEYTGRSYETYLRVALDIADAAMRGAINFNYEGSEKHNYEDAYERRIISIHQPEMTASFFADRAQYEAAVCRWEFRDTGKLRPEFDYDYDPLDPSVDRRG